MQRKILISTSLPSSTFELSNPYPQHTVKGPYFAQSSMQLVKISTSQKPCDLYRPGKGLGRIVENTEKLQKCFVIVAELLQIFRKTVNLFCFCVGPALEQLYCEREFPKSLSQVICKIRHSPVVTILSI